MFAGFAGCECIGGAIAEDLFEHGLCLPSGSNLTTADLEHVIHAIAEIHCGAVQNLPKLHEIQANFSIIS